MNQRRRLTAALVSVCALIATGCSLSGSDTAGDRPAAASTPTETSPSETAGSEDSEASSETPTTPAEEVEEVEDAEDAEDSAQHPSLSDYFDQVPDASPVRLGRVREETAAYTSYDVSYDSDGLRITGVLNVPTGPGPFPAVVLAHGWIERDVYVTGQGMTRERGYLAEQGYVALHVDYREHAESDDDPELVRQLYRGYAVDVLGAVSALRASDLPVDDEQIALMGRSMGGSVVLQALVMAPGFVDAGIVYSGQSSLESDNYRQWGGPSGDYADEFASLHGTPDENAAAWRDMSPRPYFTRVTEPVLMIHGTRDEQCPAEWASATEAALAEADVDVQLNWYRDERHAFIPQFDQSMADSVAFLQRRLT
ncbi:alpha/beta hydrolase family protein [Streptomyces hainanensis]|uniref:Alpha/beta fold hydrolase n=1 Tax=Streptomyces hainanensis TaxID=402648 RepID=A0A4R4T7H3_9ACTN|nr:alpha/beta fold hydrolase [Streptomyces hainanensis]TDC73118.1 alpha/beta fold hydrolase [Streptomyces hainanensis]